MQKYRLDADGNPVPCTLDEWAATYTPDFESQRVIGKDSVGDIHVSTVFLGLDHSFGVGEPVLWETMIFGGPHDEYQERYTSRADALAGHEKAVQLVRGVTA